MLRYKNPNKHRIEACIEVWGLIANGKIKSREELVKALKEAYDNHGIEPFRGISKIDLYDKEIATLYIIGKYGLNIYDEVKGKVGAIFKPEELYDKAVKAVLEGVNPKQALQELFEKVDSQVFFRILRFAVTLNLLGYLDDDKLRLVISEMFKSFPEFSERYRSFIRFYVTLKLCELIALGKVRNRIEKEILKHTLCLKFNAPKATPSDKLLFDVAVNVFALKRSILENILSKKVFEDSEAKL